MKEIENDPFAFELESYDEYVQKARIIKSRDPKFVIRPDTGKMYVWAKNQVADLWALLDKGTYTTLVSTGEWQKGIYQLWTNKRNISGRQDSGYRASEARLVLRVQNTLTRIKEMQASCENETISAQLGELYEFLRTGKEKVYG